MRLVAEEGLLFGDRNWFVDVRSPARRMSVPTHPEQGLAVISLWQGDHCTGTFRLPLRDAGRVVATLASGMAAAVPTASGQTTPQPRAWWRRLLERVPSRNRRSVTPLRRIK